MKDKIELIKAENKLPRRTILGVLTGAGALAVWHKPIIDSVILPAHAQMSVFSGQYINNNISVTNNKIASLDNNSSIIENIVGLVVPNAQAGHASLVGGHIVVDITGTSFDAFVIAEDGDVQDSSQQFEGASGTVDGAALRLDITGGFCGDTNYVELSVFDVDETSASYEMNGYNASDVNVYSSIGTVVTGLTPPANLAACM